MTAATDLVVGFMPGASPLDVAGDYYLNLTGASGGNATTPDVTALDIVGDIDVRFDATLERWAALPGTGMELAGKFVPPSNQSWLLWVNSNRRLVWRHSADGTAIFDAVSTVALPVAAGRLAVRVTMDVNDGAGNRVVTMYTAPTMAGPWATLSTITTSGTTSIFNSSATLGIGDVPSSGFARPTGRVHAFQVSADLTGTDVRANPNFALHPPGTTSFADAAGRTWTVNSPASINGFDWVDLSARLLYAAWGVGRGSELEAFPPSNAEVLLRNDDRQLDPSHAAGTWFGRLEPRTPFRIQSVASALDLPGLSGATASTPDHASYAVTDLDLRVQLAADDWTPGGFGQFIAGQWGSAGNQGWHLAVGTSGVLSLGFTTNGTTLLSRTSTAATGFGDGSDHWVRVTLDANNGAAGHDVRFYTSTDSVSWTQLGSTVTTAGTVALFNSTAPLTIGDVLSFAGQVRYLELRSSIGGPVVANPEFSARNPGTTQFTDRSGRVWTINGAAAIALDTAFRSDEFYGFVGEDGFEQIAQPPALGDCRVTLVDLLEILGDDSLPATAYDAEILSDNPVAFWKLDEADGTQMADSSGHGRHGLYDNAVLGQDPLVFGDGHSVDFPHVGDHRGRWSGEGLPVAAPCSLEAWVQTDRDALAIKSIIVVQRDASLGQRLWLGIQTSAGGSPNGEIVIDFAGLGTGYKARGHSRVDDDQPHHIVATIAGNTAAEVLLYVDGVPQTKTTISGTNPGSWPSLLLWTIGNYTDNGFGDFGLDGLVDEPAVYSYVLTAEQVRDHYEAGTTAFAEASGERVDRVLDILGVPSSMRDIATGDTTVGPAAYGGSNAGAYLQAVVESEQGYLYVNHRNGGRITYRGRFSRYTEPRSTASLATFSDSATASLHYERNGLVIDPKNSRSLVNVVDVNWRGGTVQARNQSSIDRYGAKSRKLTTEAPSPEAGLSAGDWVINRNSEPRERVRSFKLNPGADARLRQVARSLRIGDRVTFGRHPQQVGAATLVDLFVEGYTNEFTRGVEWTSDVRASAADTGDVAIWGTSTWGETAIWG